MQWESDPVLAGEVMIRSTATLLVAAAIFMVSSTAISGTPLSGIVSDQVGSDSASSQTAQQGSMSSDKQHDDSYIIGADDVLAISVWKEPELTNKAVPVRSDGKITLPLVGEMQAAGRTPLQLEQELSAKLESFIASPAVSVSVQEIKSRKFNILGEIGKPGSYPITASMTLMDAIATAGGFRDFAKKTGVYILRKSPDGKEEKLNFNYKNFIKGKNTNQNVKIEPNDTIIVP